MIDLINGGAREVKGRNRSQLMEVSLMGIRKLNSRREFISKEGLKVGGTEFVDIRSLIIMRDG
jgi:hypothetical protein